MRRQPRFAIHELLRSAGRVYSRKQEILVNFLYRNYQKVAFMNVTELAKETKVSEATVVRLATLLGFDGYPQLQKAVQRIVAQELTTLERVQMSLEQHELDHPMQRILKTDMRNLMRVYQHLAADEIDQVVRRILRAKRIVVAGFMASSPLALYFGYALNRLLQNVATYTEDGLAATRTVFDLTKDDLLIAFAFPRYPVSLVNLAETAAARSVPCVGFTDSGASPLSALASPCLFLPFEMLALFDSLAAPLSFLAGLTAEIAKREPKRTARNLKRFETLAASFNLFHREAN